MEDSKALAQNDLMLGGMLDSYAASLINGTVKEQFQRGTQLMSYVSQKLVTLTGK